jgi:hypothetical protein
MVLLARGPTPFDRLLLARVSAQATSSPGAQAEPPTSAGSSAAPSSEDKSARQRSGVSLLVSVGYGGSTQHVYRAHLEPYAASFGFDSGYTFRNGLRLGAYAQLGLGRRVSQDYNPALGDNYRLAADSMSVGAGASIAYDLPLYMFVLRYSLQVGFTRMTWDFGDAPRVPLGFDAASGTQYGFTFLPGLSLLWTVRAFQCGLGVEYIIQSEGRIPSGLVGKLLLGVKL